MRLRTVLERQLPPAKPYQAYGKTPRIRFIAGFAALSVLALGGCAALNRKLAQSDNILELAMALGGQEEIDVCRVEKISHGSGRIATGRVRRDDHGVFVSGYVQCRGPGSVTGARSHVDVAVLDSKGRTMHKVATRFFPSEVMHTRHGIPGNSRYYVRLPFPPPANATVSVTFHQTPQSECESAR